MAESTGKRIEAENRARRQEILRDTRMLALVVLLVWWGVSWALKPLRRLRNDIRGRRPDDLTPLDASRVPSEVSPLVDAVNHHIARYRRVLDEQSQFLADASHQLRTPLAIMRRRARQYARERDPARAQEGLRAIVDQLGRTRRLTEQLLSLAHANQADQLPRQLLDMNAVSREVVLQYLPLAHEKQQDLGWVHAGAEEGLETPVPVSGNEAELHEALSNLVHNAIHYAPAGARITVSVCRVENRAEVAVRPTTGPGWNRCCAGALSRASSGSARTGPSPPPVRAWAWRLLAPTRAATMAISNCATANRTGRAVSVWPRCCGCPSPRRSRSIRVRPTSNSRAINSPSRIPLSPLLTQEIRLPVRGLPWIQDCDSA